MTEEIKEESSFIDSNFSPELVNSLKNLSNENRQLVFEELGKKFFKCLNEINNSVELGTTVVQENIFDLQKYLLSEISDIKKSLCLLNAKLDLLLSKN
uniref:Biogenesis of lysosome-related organelles complex 1 subunit BLS1 n=1 Tax=Strongyloides papillosus TaxID=174720 RepID=A0A0N5C098_STREA